MGINRRKFLKKAGISGAGFISSSVLQMADPFLYLNHLTSILIRRRYKKSGSD